MEYYTYSVISHIKKTKHMHKSNNKQTTKSKSSQCVKSYSINKNFKKECITIYSTVITLSLNHAHTPAHTHTHTHLLLSSYLCSKLLLNMEIAEGKNDSFNRLVLASGTCSLPPPSTRLLSKSEYRVCVDLQV